MTDPKLLKLKKSHPKKKKKKTNMQTHSSCALESNNTKYETPNTLLGGGINPTSKQKTKIETSFTLNWVTITNN
jgi:hypothetical protein